MTIKLEVKLMVNGEVVAQAEQHITHIEITEIRDTPYSTHPLLHKAADLAAMRINEQLKRKECSSN